MFGKELVMDVETPPLRPWRQIVQEIIYEHDLKRLRELSDELVRALEEQDRPNSQKGAGAAG